MRHYSSFDRSWHLGLLVTGIAILAPALRAQSVCLVATPKARQSITYFLRDSSELPWRQARGISATQVDDLRPLSDASDAAMCRRIDSTQIARPAYYFQAGAYIIASNSRDLAEDPVAGTITVGEGPRIFVFDSLGRYIHAPGQDDGAPVDLATSRITSDLVAFKWTPLSQAVTRYQLQRAVGTGAFSNIGAPLAESVSSTTDASVTTGVAYRYRLATTSKDGVDWQSNTLNVTIADPGTVTRTTTGLLFRDQFNRPNGAVGADWVAESGSWGIVNNALEVNPGWGGSAVIRLAALANRKDFHIQATTSRSNLGNYAALQARRSGGMMYQADLGSTTEQSGKPRLYRMTSGGWVFLGYGTFTSVATTAHRLTFSIIGTSLRLYVDELRLISVADATPANDVYGNFSLNAYGAGGAGTVRFDDVVVTSSRIVSMTGLPAGFRIRAGEIMSDPALVGGTVSLDLLSTTLPIAQLEVLDADDVVVKVFAPADGVWAGDSYSFVTP